MRSNPQYTLSGFALFFVFTAVCTCSSARAQQLRQATPIARATAATAKRIMTLDAPTAEERAVESIATTVKAQVPDNFREMGTLQANQIADTRSLTLRFAASAKVTKIEDTPDFKVEQGGSCVEGYSYAANETCTLLVRFAPQGAGRRTGKVMVADSVDATPLFVGLGGYGNAPAISFTPSIISTLPGTYVSGAGIISGATNIAVDGGDSLYIADTGHNKIDYINSSGTIQNYTSSFGATAPIAVAVDHNGYTYFTQRSQFFLYILPYPTEETYFYASTSTCSVGSTCPLFDADLPYESLGALATDPSGNVYMATDESAARLTPSPDVFDEDYEPLYTSLNYNYDNSTAPQPLAVDASDTLYTYLNNGNGRGCQISGESYYGAATSAFNPVTVAGSLTCGFSGDGAQARSAEIGKQVGQMTFDIAGNLYFTDTLNQRVRRIDNATGVITTIAGNGSIGYNGDGGAATNAALSTPTGLAVDSQGQVYILSQTSTSNASQVIRKVGTIGTLNLGGLAVGSSSAAQTVTVANTGNAELDFTHVGLSSGSSAEFAMDVNTTSCNFTVPLAAGRSCKVGFIFTPVATGNRSAVLTMTDDTIAGVNTIELTGVGYTTATLTPTSFSYASTNIGSSSASQTATLKNTGKAVMTISSVALSGAGVASYLETTNCGTTLAIGASCAVAVTFKPTAAGLQVAALTVSDNALGVRQSVALTGTGVAVAKVSISPASLTFASTAVGVTSAAQTIKLSNTGSAALGITSIGRTGTNSGDYSETNNCGTSVAAAGSCSIIVAFKPTATGTRTASISIVASTGTITATLTGIATAAATKTAATTKTALTSTANPTVVRHTFVMKVQVSGDGQQIPTGTVQLWEGNHMWATGTISNGVAAFTLRQMTTGVHIMNAVYLGDTKNASSGSSSIRQMVEAAILLPIKMPGRVLSK